MTTEPTPEDPTGDSYPSLIDIFDLVHLGPDRFVAPTPRGSVNRLFGGQVMAQALRAAALTVDAPLLPHSLHGYFLRLGRAGTPLQLDVERLRDGRSFSSRSVLARQEDRVIFSLQASFQEPETRLDWNVDAPAVPGPEGIADGNWPMMSRTAAAFQARPVGTPHADGTVPMHPVWLRLIEQFPADPSLRACALAFLSDFGLARAMALRLDPHAPPGGVASLEQSVWFHRAARLEDWHLMSVDPQSFHGTRGLATGTLHTQAGVRIATFAQEALLRPPHS
jgi:acyl-CoA thioesterase-2